MYSDLSDVKIRGDMSFDLRVASARRNQDPRQHARARRLACRERTGLAADTACELRGIAGALYLNAGDCTLDLRKFASRQLDSGGAEVLL